MAGVAPLPLDSGQPPTRRFSEGDSLRALAASLPSAAEGAQILALAPAETSLAVPLPLRALLLDLALATALQVALIAAAAALLRASPACTLNGALADDCTCSAETHALLWLPQQTVYVTGAIVARVFVVLRVLAAYTTRRLVLCSACVWLLSLAVGAGVANPSGGGGDTASSYAVWLVVEIALLWYAGRRFAAAPVLRARMRPLILQLAVSALATVVIQGSMRELLSRGIEDALLLVPVQLALMEFAIVRVLRRACAEWPASVFSVVARSQVALLEGTRVGMLLVSASLSASPFDGPFLSAAAVAVPLEVLGRNDLFLSGFRKLVLRWSDARVRGRFSQSKELFLAARFDAEYAPLLLVVAAQALGSLGTPTLHDCTGKMLPWFAPGWDFVAALLGFEVLTDVLARALHAAVLRWRPLLARDLRVDRPTQRLVTWLTVLSCVFNGVVGLQGAALLADVDF